MKFASLLLLTLASASAADGAIVAKMSAQCTGVDFVKISTDAATAAAKALQDSFNKVSAGINATTTLSGVAYTGHTRRQLRSSGSIQQQRRQVVLASAAKGLFTGTLGSAVNAATFPTAAWGSAFAAALVKSGNRAFTKASACGVGLEVVAPPTKAPTRAPSKAATKAPTRAPSQPCTASSVFWGCCVNGRDICQSDDDVAPFAPVSYNHTPTTSYPVAAPAPNPYSNFPPCTGNLWECCKNGRNTCPPDDDWNKYTTTAPVSKPAAAPTAAPVK
jgi:hypothetical protein